MPVAVYHAICIFSTVSGSLLVQQCYFAPGKSKSYFKPVINLGFRCICEFGFLGFALGIQILIYILYLGYSHQRWLKPFLGSTFVNTTVKNLLIWYSLSQYLLLGGLFIALCKCHNLSSVTCLQPQFLTKNSCMRSPDLVTECCNTFS